jgi:hypothetical protein
MDINAGLIDQQVTSIVTRIGTEIRDKIRAGADEHKVRSAAFALLCLQHTLALDEQSALDAITDGGNDAGIDAIYIGDVVDGEFSTAIVQSKYSKNLNGDAGYPANSIVRIIQTIQQIFDPARSMSAHPKLEELVTEIRSLILDGNIPEVRVLLCNNGKIWEPNGETEISSSGLRDKRATFTHINHDKLVGFLQKRKSVDSHLKLSGKAIVEDFDFRRVLVGKLPVSEIRQLFDTHGDALLDRNIRRYLGLKDNRVNVGIHSTLIDAAHRGNFYFFNNGITAVCSKFAYNALQGADWDITITGLQIVNGGQTSKTIQRTVLDNPDQDFSKTYVLLRLYEISANDDAIVNSITFATNSQNPVDVTDLRSNDPVQERLALGLKSLGYDYKRKRDDLVSSGSETITASVAGEAVMAVWRRQPHAAKFRRSKLFSDFYEDVFSADLQASHVLISVLAFRLVENERKRPKQGARPRFVPYASHFLAMVVGDLLLRKAQLLRLDVTHAHVDRLKGMLEAKRNELYAQAIRQVAKALAALGIADDTPLPRVAAQFRRGDLLEPLQEALALNALRAPTVGTHRHSTKAASNSKSSARAAKKTMSRVSSNTPRPNKRQPSQPKRPARSNAPS